MARASYSSRNMAASRASSGFSSTPSYSGFYSYPTSGSAAHQRQEKRNSRRQPDIDVIGGRREETIRENNIVLYAGAVIGVLLLVITLACFARIALTNATVSVELDSQALSAELSESRSTASSLEVQDTVLSNTSRIKAAATELSMAEPVVVDEVNLADDVVAVNADGSLSFGESVKRATAAAAGE